MEYVADFSYGMSEYSDIIKNILFLRTQFEKFRYKENSRNNPSPKQLNFVTTFQIVNTNVPQTFDGSFEIKKQWETFFKIWLISLGTKPRYSQVMGK